MSEAPDTLEGAILWLREHAAQLQYGRASIEVLAHNGKITRIIVSTEVSTSAGLSLSNDNRRATNGSSR